MIKQNLEVYSRNNLYLQIIKEAVIGIKVKRKIIERTYNFDIVCEEKK